MAIPQKPDSPRELMHYGVKGMKWGVRRGGLGSRWRGAIADNSQQREQLLKRQNSGHSKGVGENVARTASIVLNAGKKRMVKNNNIEIKRMQERQARVAKKGEATARDILSGLGHVGVIDLAFSRRDNMGD